MLPGDKPRFQKVIQPGQQIDQHLALSTFTVSQDLLVGRLLLLFFFSPFFWTDLG